MVDHHNHTDSQSAGRPGTAYRPILSVRVRCTWFLGIDSRLVDLEIFMLLCLSLRINHPCRFLIVEFAMQ